MRKFNLFIVSHALQIETAVSILFALSSQFFLVYFLGASGYSDFAHGLTISIFFYVCSLGLPQLIPRWVIHSEKSENRLINGLVMQVIAIISTYFVLAMIIYMSGDQFFVEYEINYSLLFFAALYFLAAQFDESIHVFLRVSDFGIYSLTLSLVSKITILGALFLAITLSSTHTHIFSLYSLVFFVLALTKFLLVACVLNLHLHSLVKSFEFSFKEFKEMILGNLSNVMFNSLMRLEIGSIFGKPVVACFVLANQIGSALVQIISSFSLSSAKSFAISNGSDQKKFNSFFNEKFFILIALCSFSSLILVYFITYGMLSDVSLNDPKINISLWICLPLSLATFSMVISAPFFVACQFVGFARRLSLVNFALASSGVGYILLFRSDAGLNDSFVFIHSLIIIFSALYSIFLIFEYKNH